MKPALLIIDIQNKYLNLDTETAQSLKVAIEYINVAIDLFREHHLPIIAIQHTNAKSGLVPGQTDFDIPESVKLTDSDTRIIKTYSNAFNKTELLPKLREMGVDTVIVTGYCAEYCVYSTCVGAEDNDLVPIILKGSLASGKSDRIRLVEEINDTITLGALRTVL